MAKLTEEQYRIIAARMIEEHRKYGDRLRPGHWADVAARKVVSNIDDFRESERLFTEGEVRAMLHDLKDQTISMAVEQSINRIATKHLGITLDPA